MEELKFHERKDHVFSNKSSKAQKDILDQTYIEGRVCERMSCEQSRILFTFAEIPHWSWCYVGILPKGREIYKHGCLRKNK